MNCPSCGKINSKGAAFCGQCGAKLTASPIAENQLIASRRTWPFVGILILIIGISGLFLRQHRNNKASTVLPTNSNAQDHLTSFSSYDITDLGVLNGIGSEAYGLNNNGQVVGKILTDRNNWDAFIWQNGQMTDIQQQTEATSINDSGQVTLDNGKIWKNGQITVLPGSGPQASYINNKGTVVGSCFLGSDMRGFVWQNGQMTYLDGTQHPEAINNNGLAACTKFTWQTGDGKTTFYIPDPDKGDFRPYGINDSNQIVGEYAYSPGEQTIDRNNIELHPALWQSGNITDLGTLEGMGTKNKGTAYAINNHEQVVGAIVKSDQLSGTSYPTSKFSSDPDKDFKSRSTAFIWQDGQIKELDSLLPSGSGWMLRGATAINDKGQIAGFGLINGQEHAFLLTPK